MDYRLLAIIVLAAVLVVIICVICYLRGAKKSLGAAAWLGTAIAVAAIVLTVLEFSERADDGSSRADSSSGAKSPGQPIGTAAIENLDSDEKYPMCVKVTGEASLQPQESIVVGVHTTNERWYFEGLIDWDAQHKNWTAYVQLGDVNDKPLDPYTVAVIVLREDLADYLVSTNPEDGNTWWSSPKLPPGGQITSDVAVERSDTKPCS